MYEWIAETFGVGDGIARAMSFIIALAIVFGLIGVVLFVLRQLTGNRIATGRSRQPRIAVMDAMHIDTRRKLLLVRRDNVEHLILVGGPTDVVVEQAIVRGTPVSASYPRTGQPNAQPAPQYGTAPFEGEGEPYMAQTSWPSQPAAGPAAAPVSAPAPAAPQQAATPVQPVQPAVQPRATSLRQTAQEAALAALRSRSSTPRVEAAGQTSEDSDNVKSLRPRLAALTEPLRRSPAAAPATGPEQAPVSVAPQTSTPAPAPTVQAKPAPAVTVTADVGAVDAQRQPAQVPAQVNEGFAATASNLTSKAGASVVAAGAAVADLARSLSKSSERPQPAPEPEVKRQLTPPSSGPAARARTAFPNAAVQPLTPAPASTASAAAPATVTAPPAQSPAVVSPAPATQASASQAVPTPQASGVRTFAGFPAQGRSQTQPETNAEDVAVPAQPSQERSTPEPKASTPMSSVTLGVSGGPAAARQPGDISAEVRLTPLKTAAPEVAAPQVAASQHQTPASPVAQVEAPMADAHKSETGAAMAQAMAGDDIFEMDVTPEPKPVSSETVEAAATLAALTVGPDVADDDATNAPVVSTRTISQVIPEISLTAADLEEPVAAAPEVVVSAGEAPAASRDGAGVNAIEEEMARLLSEIGVQGRK